MSMIDLIMAILRDQNAACRLESGMVRSTFFDVDGKWRNLMFIVEGDMIYAVRAGNEHQACFNDPEFDIYRWIKSLRGLYDYRR